MHNSQEQNLNNCLDCHYLDINQLWEEHNTLQEGYQELEAGAAELRIHLSHMSHWLCHCANRCNPPISAVGFPFSPSMPAPAKSLDFHTPNIEVQSLGDMLSYPPSPNPIPIPPPTASPLPPSDVKNVPPPYCANLLPPYAPLMLIEEVMSDAEDSDTITERAEEALDEEVALTLGAVEVLPRE